MNRGTNRFFRYIPSRAQIIALLIVAVPTVIFLELAEDVWLLEGFWWDQAIALAVHRLANPWLTQVVRFITFTGGNGALLIFAAFVIWLWMQRQWNWVVILAICFIGSGLLNLVLKALFVRPRPTLFTPLVVVSGYSFPSGHSVAGITMYGVIALFLWQQRRFGWAISAAIWGLLIGLSRVYLGVHYPSDVVAAWMAGALWIYVTYMTVRWVQNRHLLGTESETEE